MKTVTRDPLLAHIEGKPYVATPTKAHTFAVMQYTVDGRLIAQAIYRPGLATYQIQE